MDAILDKINAGIDYVFSLMEKVSGFCLDKLELSFKHAYAWSVVIGAVMVLLIGMIGSPYGGFWKWKILFTFS